MGPLVAPEGPGRPQRLQDVRSSVDANSQLISPVKVHFCDQVRGFGLDLTRPGPLFGLPRAFGRLREPPGGSGSLREADLRRHIRIIMKSPDVWLWVPIRVRFCVSWVPQGPLAINRAYLVA